jgi:GntR family transcriptional regulator
MYGLFESHFGTHMVRAHEKITAELPNDIAVEFLKISQITPILHIFRVAYTYGDLPVEVRQSQNLTDDYHYANNLS